MRLNDFVTVDEVVELGKIEFQKRSFAPTINWMPPRQNVYTSQCKKYSSMLLNIGNTASEKELIEADMNPSQFVKSAQDFQLSARMAGIETDVILKNFIKLANIGMMLRRHYHAFYTQKIQNIVFCREPEIIAKANQLNGLLRAFSESIYFDDHTVSGEFYGDLEKEGKTIIIRSYKRLCPSDFLNGFDKFQVQKVETYCQYKSGHMDFDCLGNIQYLDNIRPEIDGFYAECLLKDGKRLVLNSLSLLNEIINIIESQLKNVLMSFFSADSYTRDSLLLKSAYYAFKPILDKLNISWCPTDNDISLYIESTLSKAEFDKVSEEKNVFKFKQDILRIIDPRCNIEGGDTNA